MTRYRVYDVFTDKPFGGNPLAVIPDATALPEACLQRIAREFNFSETCFVTPPRDPSHSARVRIFTPTMEIPFAGHPTIGTAMCLSDLGYPADMVLELGIGPIAATVGDHGASFTSQTPLTCLAEPAADLVAACLGLPPEAIRRDTHPPVQCGVGLDFTLVELRNRADLAACRTDIAAFREGLARHPGGLDFAILAYVRNGADIDARMFAPLDNIPEDPATGSAAAALAALLSDRRGQDQALTIRQGVDMGRPSLIRATTSGGAVTISGQAVLMMEGQLVQPSADPAPDSPVRTQA